MSLLKQVCAGQDLLLPANAMLFSLQAVQAGLASFFEEFAGLSKAS